ncbi:MAG: hypothetical protein EXS58_07800 [Candidatus Latescibacteria bacterium]|nr:hypothetical protein [Candidatus Latescibacterota bacterium]
MGAPRPIEPSYLFTVPAGRVVRSMDLDVAASGVFFSAGGEKPVGGAVVLGLGDIAELELGSLALSSSLQGTRQVQVVPAGGLRVYLPVWRYWQGVSASFRRSGTIEEQVGGVSYQEKVGHFSLTATLANFPSSDEGSAAVGGWEGIKVKAHLGLIYVDPNMQSTGQEISGQEGFWRPYGGLELWRRDSRARVMAELAWNADFGPQGRIEKIATVTGGVRFFFSKHVTADIGVKHQSDYHGLSELVMQFKVRMAVPTHLLRERVVGR